MYDNSSLLYLMASVHKNINDRILASNIKIATEEIISNKQFCKNKAIQFIYDEDDGKTYIGYYYKPRIYDYYTDEDILNGVIPEPKIVYKRYCISPPVDLRKVCDHTEFVNEVIYNGSGIQVHPE